MHTTILVGILFMLTGVLLAANDATSGIKAAAEKQAGRHGRKLEHAAAGALSNAAQRIDKEVGKADSAVTHEARKAEHAAQRAASHAEKKIGTRGQAVRKEVADDEKKVVKSAKELVPAAKELVPPTPEITKPAAAAIDALGKVAPLSGAVVTNLGAAMDASTPAPPASAPTVAPPTAAPAPADAVKAAAPAPAPPEPPAPARKKWWKFWSKG